MYESINSLIKSLYLCLLYKFYSCIFLKLKNDNYSKFIV